MDSILEKYAEKSQEDCFGGVSCRVTMATRQFNSYELSQFLFFLSALSLASISFLDIANLMNSNINIIVFEDVAELYITVAMTKASSTLIMFIVGCVIMSVVILIWCFLKSGLT